MSYLGLVNGICRDFLPKVVKDQPIILEIGIDKGLSALPIIQNLSYKFDHFLYVGIDILVRQEVVEQISQFENVSIYGLDELSGRDVILVEDNSLNWLPQQIEMNSPLRFDIVFIDGDHNYYTVLQELKLVKPLLKPTSIIVCDDFNGPWAEQDLFYSEREEYALIESATSPYGHRQPDKQGVQTAIYEFLNEDDGWLTYGWPELEPLILYRKDQWKRLSTDGGSPGHTHLRNWKFDFEPVEPPPAFQRLIGKENS